MYVLDAMIEEEHENGIFFFVLDQKATNPQSDI
jgi:hypothetical protein